MQKAIGFMGTVRAVCASASLHGIMKPDLCITPTPHTVSCASRCGHPTSIAEARDIIERYLEKACLSLGFFRDVEENLYTA